MYMAKKNVKENETYILPSDNDALITFVDTHKFDMMEHIISSIEFAIKNKLSLIEVFQFKNSKFVVTISDKEFESNLENVFDCYMEHEAYELCDRVVKLQKLLKRKHNEKKIATKTRRTKNSKNRNHIND